MKKLLFLLLIPVITMAQSNNEIYLFDIKSDNGKLKIANGKNISNNEGYDSQPHFYNDNILLFASTRNGQTDIAKYNVRNNVLSYLNSTPNGGEYSPQKIPNSKHVSAVRLDKNGLQRFYKYNYKTGKDTELIKDLVVAYPMWYDKNTVVASVIVNNNLELVVVNVKKQKITTISKNSGRSIHKIPNSNLVSFMKRNGKNWEVWSLNPKTKEQKKIVSIGNNQDMCWLQNGSMLIANGSEILKFNPQKDAKPTMFYDFKGKMPMANISRIATNANSSKLLVVAQVDPEYYAQQQLIAYNNRDIEAFLKVYAKDVKVYRFPNKLEYVGIDKMRKRYAPMFAKTKDLHCKILSRVVKGNVVIDEEWVTSRGRQFKAVAIYEIKNGKIATVTFVR